MLSYVAQKLGYLVPFGTKKPDGLTSSFAIIDGSPPNSPLPDRGDTPSSSSLFGRRVTTPLETFETDKLRKAEDLSQSAPIRPPESGAAASSLGVHARPLRILCLDGGGARGIYTLQILRELESQLSRPLHDSFDLICGTSTGGIIAAALGLLNLSLDEIEELYKGLAASVFPAGPLAEAEQSWEVATEGAKYSASNLEKYLKQVFSDVKLLRPPNEDGPKVFLTSARFDVTPAEGPYIFRSYPFEGDLWSMEGSSDPFLWEALRASSAAPTYFIPAIINGRQFVDGGLVANNPSLCAIEEARSIWPDRPIGCVISVGTGRPKPLVAEVGTGVFKMFGIIAQTVDVSMDTSMIGRACHYILGRQYIRINGDLIGSEADEELDQVKLVPEWIAAGKDAAQKFEWGPIVDLMK